MRMFQYIADDYRSGSLWLPKSMMSSFC